MGVDLRLLPFNRPASPQRQWQDSSHVLSVERRSSLWGAIEEIQAQHGQPLPEGFHSYEGDGRDGYGTTVEDAYGSKVVYVFAQHLKPLRTREEVVTDPMNRAIWAFIEALPDDWPIALYWH